MDWLTWLEATWPILLLLVVGSFVLCFLFEIIPPGWFPGDKMIMKIGRWRQRH